VKKLLDDIHRVNPKVIFFGEHHIPDSKFRQLVYDLLPVLRADYSTLALELRPCFESIVKVFCENKITYSKFFSKLELQWKKGTQINSVDEKYCLAIKRWTETGGQLLLINSDDPTAWSTTNDQGRDHFMAQNIMALADTGVVALLGSMHTFVRPTHVRDQGCLTVAKDLGFFEELYCGPDIAAEREMKIIEHCRRYLFTSAAEKVEDTGITTYQCAHITPADLTDLSKFQFGVALRSELTEEQKLEYIPEYAGDSEDDAERRGKRNDLAPELIPQSLTITLSLYDAIFLEDIVIPA
jgi:hypothetical protein